MSATQQQLDQIARLVGATQRQILEALTVITERLDRLEQHTAAALTNKAAAKPPKQSPGARRGPARWSAEHRAKYDASIARRKAAARNGSAPP